MKANKYYKILINLQSAWRVGMIISAFSFLEQPKFMFLFIALHAGTILSKINILLETKHEADPHFWDMVPPE